MAASKSDSADGGGSSRGIREIAGLAAALSVVAKVHYRMELPALRIFLEIAQRGTVPVADLGKAVGVQAASVSRTVLHVLGDGKPSEPGLGWVESYPDPENRRFHYARLTSKGEAVARNLGLELRRYMK
jgi:DNA-binding MarR family transcriptional regulator